VDSDHPNEIADVVLRAQSGDAEAYRGIVLRYEDRLREYVTPRLGRHLQARVDVEDVLQETFLSVFQLIDRFEWRGESAFWAWLLRICENRIGRQARRELSKRRDPTKELAVRGDEPEIAGVSPSRLARRNERFERLKLALEALRPDYQKAILLAYLQKLPTKEIARRLGRSPNATSMLLLRAYRQMRHVLGETDSFSLGDEHSLDEEDFGNGLRR
jgi:RNA polymerase sigma-70 factor (ECF subfamily)